MSVRHKVLENYDKNSNFLELCEASHWRAVYRVPLTVCHEYVLETAPRLSATILPILSATVKAACKCAREAARVYRIVHARTTTTARSHDFTRSFRIIR